MNTGPSPTGGPDDIVFILIVILTAIPAALVGLGTAFAFAKIIAKRQEGDGAVAAGADGFLGAMTGLPIGIATGVLGLLYGKHNNLS